MKVWITKHALTTGLIQIEAEIVKGGYASGKHPNSVYRFFTKQWVESKEDAVSEVMRLRDNRILTLKKQIARLEEITPETVKVTT